jgi:hypothetical protein
MSRPPNLVLSLLGALGRGACQRVTEMAFIWVGMTLYQDDALRHGLVALSESRQAEASVSGGHLISVNERQVPRLSGSAAPEPII